jgi:hypothetical protein
MGIVEISLKRYPICNVETSTSFKLSGESPLPRTGEGESFWFAGTKWGARILPFACAIKLHLARKSKFKKNENPETNNQKFTNENTETTARNLLP